MSRKNDNPMGFVIFVCLAFVGVLVFILAVAKCAPLTASEQDGCEWEQKPRKASHGFLQHFGKGPGTKPAVPAPRAPAARPAAPAKPNLNKGPTAKPAPKITVKKYSETNPPPRPRTAPASGKVWVLDCD